MIPLSLFQFIVRKQRVASVAGGDSGKILGPFARPRNRVTQAGFV